MRRALPVLLVSIALALGGVVWLLRGRDSRTNSPPSLHVDNSRVESIPTRSAASGEGSAGEVDESRSRVQALPDAAVPVDSATPTAVEPAPTTPRPGASIRAIFGGSEVYSDVYGRVSSEERKARLLEIDAVLEEYSGDPADKSEFEKYEALKEESEWLRAHT